MKKDDVRDDAKGTTVIHWGKRVFSQMVLEQLAIYRRGNKNVNHLLHCTKI